MILLLPLLKLLKYGTEGFESFIPDLHKVFLDKYMLLGYFGRKTKHRPTFILLLGIR